jgi:hypothetical protein
MDLWGLFLPHLRRGLSFSVPQLTDFLLCVLFVRPLETMEESALDAMLFAPTERNASPVLAARRIFYGNYFCSVLMRETLDINIEMVFAYGSCVIPWEVKNCVGKRFSAWFLSLFQSRIIYSR